MIKLKIFVLMILFGIVGTVVYGYTQKEYVTYFGTTDQTITIGWDAVVNTDYYRVYLNSQERNREIDIGVTNTNQMELTLPRSGHYVIKIIACKIVEDGDDLCSEPALSTDSTTSTVDDENQGWWIYGHVAAPGPITIE